MLKEDHQKDLEKNKSQILKEQEDLRSEIERDLKEKLRRSRDKDINQAVREIKQQMTEHQDEIQNLHHDKLKYVF